MSDKTVGLLGGSFDPPHMGHVLLAACGLVGLGLDEVWLVPCRRHPFGKPTTGFEDRVRMCRLAVAALGDHVRVEAIEGELGTESEPSHMIETVQSLRDRHAGVAFRLLIGSDLAAELDEWREIERLRKIAPPLVVPRMGYGMLDPKSESPEALPAISSTIVRERVESGESLEGWVPHAVAQYIRRMDLYGAAAPH